MGCPIMLYSSRAMLVEGEPKHDQKIKSGLKYNTWTWSTVLFKRPIHQNFWLACWAVSRPEPISNVPILIELPEYFLHYENIILLTF